MKWPSLAPSLEGLMYFTVGQILRPWKWVIHRPTNPIGLFRCKLCFSNPPIYLSPYPYVSTEPIKMLRELVVILNLYRPHTIIRALIYGWHTHTHKENNQLPQMQTDNTVRISIKKQYLQQLASSCSLTRRASSPFHLIIWMSLPPTSDAWPVWSQTSWK
jgi:hypothetical protein